MSLQGQSLLPVTKMIDLCHKPFSVVTDSLVARGWRYGGVDTSANTRYSEAVVWTYKFDPVKNRALNYLTVNRLYKSDTVDSISEYINEKYYNELIKLLPKLNFSKKQTTHKDGYGLSQVFTRHATFIEIRTFLSRGNNDQNETFYLIEVVKVMEDEDYIKASSKQ